MKHAHAMRQTGDALTGLARMTHEIRTPLNVVLGALELTLKTPLTAEQQEYLSMMKTAGSSLLSVVNGILDFSRIEAGALELEDIPFPLDACIDETVQMLSLEAQRKGLSLRSELQPGLPRRVSGDPMRLRQILVNLIGNAIKFTERGEIVVRAAPCQSEEAGLACHFSVSDPGIGIPAEQQARIFDAFRQADTATARHYGGSGLGLSIVASLVRMMHGDLWLDSRPGRGSTFHFTAVFGEPAPVARAAAPVVAVAAPIARRALNVLLAEDDLLNRRLAQITLEQAGHQVRLAKNGAEACELRLNWQPDVVLMDLNMPDMDGHAAAIRMRQDEIRLGLPRTPILALSADVSPAALARGLAAGMDGQLGKPVNPDELLQALEAPVLASTRPLHAGILDQASLLDRLGGNLQLLAEVRQIFIHDSRLRLARLRSELAGTRREATLDVLHTLRGMCRNLSARNAAETVDRLEEAVLHARPAGISAGLNALEEDFSAIDGALLALLRNFLPTPGRKAVRHPLAAGGKGMPRVFSSRAPAISRPAAPRRITRMSSRRIAA